MWVYIYIYIYIYICIPIQYSTTEKNKYEEKFLHFKM